MEGIDIEHTAHRAASSAIDEVRRELDDERRRRQSLELRVEALELHGQSDRARATASAVAGAVAHTTSEITTRLYLKYGERLGVSISEFLR